MERFCLLMVDGPLNKADLETFLCGRFCGRDFILFLIQSIVEFGFEYC